jgi:hypothetical protein
VGGPEPFSTIGPAGQMQGWWMQLRSYRELNTANFKVINELGNRLPVEIFADEWKYLKQDPIRGRRNRYAELATSERVVR